MVLDYGAGNLFLLHIVQETCSCCSETCSCCNLFLLQCAGCRVVCCLWYARGVLPLVCACCCACAMRTLPTTVCCLTRPLAVAMNVGLGVGVGLGVDESWLDE